MSAVTCPPIRWRPARQWRRHRIPQRWRQRLLDRGSLTRRLIDDSAGRFAVEIVRQTLLVPNRSEARLLGMPWGRRALVREVFLWGAGERWVFARSVLPLTTLTGRLRALRHLDNRPLGALLFSDPGMTRGPLEIARVSGACIPGNVEPASAQLWGRRSLFFLDAKPLLVSEIFLSAYNG